MKTYAYYLNITTYNKDGTMKNCIFFPWDTKGEMFKLFVGKYMPRQKSAEHRQETHTECTHTQKFGVNNFFFK